MYGKKGHFIKDCKEKEVRVVDIRLINANNSIIYARPQNRYSLEKNGIIEWV